MTTLHLAASNGDVLCRPRRTRKRRWATMVRQLDDIEAWKPGMARFVEEAVAYMHQRLKAASEEEA